MNFDTEVEHSWVGQIFNRIVPVQRTDLEIKCSCGTWTYYEELDLVYNYRNPPKRLIDMRTLATDFSGMAAFELGMKIGALFQKHVDQAPRAIVQGVLT